MKALLPLTFTSTPPCPMPTALLSRIRRPLVEEGPSTSVAPLSCTLKSCLSLLLLTIANPPEDEPMRSPVKGYFVFGLKPPPPSPVESPPLLSTTTSPLVPDRSAFVTGAPGRTAPVDALDGDFCAPGSRSEERRVGKECRSRWS